MTFTGETTKLPSGAISDKDYEHAQNVRDSMKEKNLGEYTAYGTWIGVESSFKTCCMNIVGMKMMMEGLKSAVNVTNVQTNFSSSC